MIDYFILFLQWTIKCISNGLLVRAANSSESFFFLFFKTAVQRSIVHGIAVGCIALVARVFICSRLA